MEANKDLPTWLLPAILGAVIVAALLIGIFAWRKQAPTATVGQDIPVHPGMYDMRRELQKPRGTKTP